MLPDKGLCAVGFSRKGKGKEECPYLVKFRRRINSFISFVSMVPIRRGASVPLPSDVAAPDTALPSPPTGLAALDAPGPSCITPTPVAAGGCGGWAEDLLGTWG